MNFKSLMIITAMATIGFGSGFIFVPKTLSALYGISSTPIIEFSLRLYATALLGIGVLAWLVGHSQKQDYQKTILIAFLVFDFGGFLVALYAKLAGLMRIYLVGRWSLYFSSFL